MIMRRRKICNYAEKPTESDGYMAMKNTNACIWLKVTMMIVSRTEEDCKVRIEGEDIETLVEVLTFGEMICAD